MATKYSTLTIGPKQAAKAFHAVRYATEHQRALNLLVTIELSTLGVAPDEAGTLFRQLWARVARWWAYQRSKGRDLGTFDGFAVHEHPQGGPRHVHWLLRVPLQARADFERVVRNRLEKLTKLSCVGNSVHLQNVEAPGGVAKYTLKGLNPAYGAHFFVRTSDQGEIHGRRITISRSIGTAARKKAG